MLMNYYGMPMDPQIANYYAWSPQDKHYLPKWIDGIYDNADNGNYIVYTRDPMKKFVLDKDDHLVKADIGGIVIYLIVNRAMWENWWEVSQVKLTDLEKHNNCQHFSYFETAEKYY